MIDAEKRAREAFESLEVPPGLNERTLTTIETHRNANTQRAAFSPVRPKRKAPVRAIAMAAACLALVLIGVGVGGALVNSESGGTHGNVPEMEQTSSPQGESATDPLGTSQTVEEATAFIALDINPSIELELNATDEVIRAQGLNEDGKCLLAAIATNEADFMGKPAGEALSIILESNAFAPYIDENSYLALSVTCEDAVQRDRLLKTGETCLLPLPCNGSCRPCTPEERLEALEMNMGVQRYRAAQELMKLDETLTWEECAGMSMRELRDRIAALEGKPA